MQRLAIAITFALAACAHGSSSVDNSAQTTTGSPHMAQSNGRESDDDVTCTTEQRTGTHLDRRVCRTQTEKDLDRHSVETLMHAPVRKR